MTNEKNNEDKENKSQKFEIEFINFFKKFVGDASQSLKMLSKLQKNHPNEYNQFKEFQKNPIIMTEMFNSMNTNIKSRLLTILLASITLSRKVNVDIFNLSSKEQIALSEEIDQFVTLSEEYINEIKEMQNERK